VRYLVVVLNINQLGDNKITGYSIENAHTSEFIIRFFKLKKLF